MRPIMPPKRTKTYSSNHNHNNSISINRTKSKTKPKKKHNNHNHGQRVGHRQQPYLNPSNHDLLIPTRPPQYDQPPMNTRNSYQYTYPQPNTNTNQILNLPPVDSLFGANNNGINGNNPSSTIMTPSKPPPPQRRRKTKRSNPKYPRVVRLGKEKWVRTYSKEEKKYFWTCDNGKKSSWNPWNNYKQVAPWMANNGNNNWSKFKDDSSKPYWYNYKSGKSTYKKPASYVSDEEILVDSADEGDHY